MSILKHLTDGKKRYLKRAFIILNSKPLLFFHNLLNQSIAEINKVIYNCCLFKKMC